jgi:hypothetical protein
MNVVHVRKCAREIMLCRLVWTWSVGAKLQHELPKRMYQQEALAKAIDN